MSQCRQGLKQLLPASLHSDWFVFRDESSIRGYHSLGYQNTPCSKTTTNTPAATLSTVAIPHHTHRQTPASIYRASTSQRALRSVNAPPQTHGRGEGVAGDMAEQERAP